MTKRAKYFFAAAALAALAASLVPSRVRAQQGDRTKQLGAKLMCMCGCGQVLTQCNHIGCTYLGQELKELDALVARGESDDLTLQGFVQEYGEAVLATPPAKGFNAAVWYITPAAFLLGLAIVAGVIRMWRQREPLAPASSGAAAMPTPAGAAPSALDERLARARQQADHETED